MKKNYRTIKFAFSVAFASLVLASFTSCGKKDENSPGVEFMPDMYRSPSLEYYQVHTVDGDTLNNAMKPVKGSVARGFLPYAYPNTAEGYTQAGANLHNPLSVSNREKWENEGEVLYGKFCVHCHGVTGAGDGKVGAKLPGPPPAYDGALKDLPEGKIFHTLTYGKGTMGSHASQLTQEERWKLVYFVQKLQGPKVTAAADSSKTMPAKH
ncbi:c-type cytochrome [Aurantibacillus circumpalustris]|uniref:c-type cytochrome n=1 Tax=Aurantibacillus circumpalustris TaxID=3036359 RepID=UPI00295B8D13|nr:cytochrome c [Aurantibacillus circumpalustris]